MGLNIRYLPIYRFTSTNVNFQQKFCIMRSWKMYLFYFLSTITEQKKKKHVNLLLSTVVWIFILIE